MFSNRHVKPETLDPQKLAQVWQGKTQDEFAEASIIGTVAVALKLMGKADDQVQAQSIATEFWLQRNKLWFG